MNRTAGEWAVLNGVTEWLVGIAILVLLYRIVSDVFGSPRHIYYANVLGWYTFLLFVVVLWTALR
jgi:hypothetical protein